jgi:hypothetical protein
LMQTKTIQHTHIWKYIINNQKLKITFITLKQFFLSRKLDTGIR